MSVLRKLQTLSQTKKHPGDLLSWYVQQAIKLADKIERDAKNNSGFKGEQDRSQGYQTRASNYFNVHKQHQLVKQLKLHIAAGIKVAEQDDFINHSAVAPIPNNQPLWDKIKAQAKKKFKEFPSYVASLWIVKQYQRAGGHFAGDE